MIHIVPTLEDNYTYVIEDGGKVVLIDCGEAGPVLDFLKHHSLTPTHLLCTHHHGDHIAGLKDLKTVYPDIKIYAPEKDLPRIPDAEYGLSDGDTILNFSCIETKGHTLHHLCFYNAGLKTLFTGDALFSMGCGRLFEGTPGDLYISMQKLKALPEDTQIYCGHEYTLKNGEFCQSIEPTNIKLQERIDHVRSLRAKNRPTVPVSLRTEKETNVFLRAETEDDIAHLRKTRDTF